MLFTQLRTSATLFLTAASTDISQSLFDLIQEERSYLEQWMDWPKPIDSLSRCRRYIREMELMNKVGQQFFSFVIYEKQLAGSIALSKIDKHNLSAELGFWKSQRRLPKHQMHLAMQSFIQACWSNSSYHRLEIQTPASNLAAKALSTKLGFRLEGSKREAIRQKGQFENLDIYGLLRRPKAIT